MEEKEFQGCQPAGWQGQPAGGPSPGPVGAALGVIVATARDARTLTWLRQAVGDAAIINAVERLPGGRKPYVSNISKLLDVTPSADLVLADPQTAAECMAKMPWRRQKGG
jgi:hypothetical protein